MLSLYEKKIQKFAIQTDWDATNNFFKNIHALENLVDISSREVNIADGTSKILGQGTYKDYREWW